MNNFRIGSRLYEIAVYEEADMLDMDMSDLEQESEEEWKDKACGRYRSV